MRYELAEVEDFGDAQGSAGPCLTSMENRAIPSVINPHHHGVTDERDENQK